MKVNTSFRLQAAVHRWTLLLLAGLMMVAAYPHRAAAQQSNCGDRVRMTYWYVDNCVWDLNLMFNNMPNINRITLTPVAPTTINWTTAAPGVSTASTPTQAAWTMIGGSPFPMGANVPVGTISINPNGALPQVFIVEYFDKKGNLICRETIYFDCPIEPPHHQCNYPDNCLTNKLIVSTGYDHVNGTTYTPPTLDSYWKVVGAPGWAGLSLPHDAYVIVPNGAWFTGATAPPSQWISAFAQAGSNAANMPPQDPYVFERCFCVCESNGQLHIRLNVYADNIARVYFDGNLIGQTNQSSVSANFQYPTVIDTWVQAGPGEHCLRAELNNDHPGSPMGLRIDGFVDQGTLVKDECCHPLSSVTILKYWDKNCNGIHDEPWNVNLEPGLQGWTFTLYDQFSNPINTGVSDINGNLSFNNLYPGTYTICETPQAGWYNTQPGTNCYTFTVGSAPASFYYEFGNCKQDQHPCDEFGDGSLDSLCCEFNLGIINLPGNIIDIQYTIIGGVTNYINTAPCLPSSTTPTNLFGQPGGVLHYSPYCNSNVNVDIGITPTTSSGVVTILWVVRHVMADGSIMECTHQSKFRCMPTPKLRCDSLDVQPFVFNGLDLSGRTFTVINNKIPASPICRIEISLNPPPLGGSYQWAGGGLVVDGLSRSWSFPYTFIDLAGGSNVSPAGAANNTVKFNLGVDYTINWTGSVTIRVIHCDGDTCDTFYQNWCAKPDPADCANGNPPDQATPQNVDKDKLFVASVQLNGTANTRWVSLAVENSEDAVFASGADYSPDAQVALVQHGVAAGNHTLFEVQRVAGNEAGDFTSTLNLVVYRGNAGEIPTIRWTSYDADGNPFATGLVETTAGAIVVGAGDDVDMPASSTFKLERSVPNPANNETTIYYHLGRLMDVRLEVYDAVGRLMDVVQSGRQPAGTNNARYNTSHLQAGVYYVKLSSGGQTVTMPLTIIR